MGLYRGYFTSSSAMRCEFFPALKKWPTVAPLRTIARRKQVLTEQAKQWGQIRWDTPAQAQASAKQVSEMLQLIVATREFQFA